MTMLHIYVAYIPVVNLSEHLTRIEIQNFQLHMQ